MATVKIETISSSETGLYGEADIRPFTSKDIVRQMLKNWGFFWGLALISVFLPVIHFFLVPLFLLLGVIFGIRARKFKSEILSGQIPCPNCSQLVILKKTPAVWPHTENCRGCSFVLRISPCSDFSL